MKHLIDLTQTINSDIPTWEGSCGFHANTLCNYDQGVKVQSFNMLAGIGTHMDAPSHFVEKGKSIADIPLEQLINPAIVIDVRQKIHPDYFVTPQDILAFEKAYQRIQGHSIVLFCTGWNQYWNTPQKYRNLDENNHMHFPGVSADTAELLLERDIAGIGIDTLSPDGSNMDFPVHKLLLPHDKFIIENVTHLEKLPIMGAHLAALPLKIEGATESPCRVIGLTLS